jgi:hypothetical protein
MESAEIEAVRLQCHDQARRITEKRGELEALLHRHSIQENALLQQQNGVRRAQEAVEAKTTLSKKLEDQLEDLVPFQATIMPADEVGRQHRSNSSPEKIKSVRKSLGDRRSEGGNTVYYYVSASKGTDKWLVRKRYSEFRQLWQALKPFDEHKSGCSKLSYTFPPKQVFMSASQAVQRRQQLDEFLHKVLRDSLRTWEPVSARQRLLHTFLDVQEHKKDSTVITASASTSQPHGVQVCLPRARRSGSLGGGKTRAHRGHARSSSYGDRATS